MQYQKGLSLRDKTARSGVPQTRSEVEAMIARSAPTPVLRQLRQWLALDEELGQLDAQVDHVSETLNDRVLCNMLADRKADLIQTLLRLARDLARLDTKQPADIRAKAYTLMRMDALHDDRALKAEMCRIILADVDRLGIEIGNIDRQQGATRPGV